MRIILFLFAALLFFSCQKVINLKLPNGAPQIVIEGEITDQPGPYTVTINKSVNFYASNTFPPVSGATVTVKVNTGGYTDTLTETSPGVYATNVLLQGFRGNGYTLSATVGDTTYTAVSVMPQPVNLDSVTFQSSTRFGNSRITAVVNFQDPPGVPNYYQFIEYINGVQFTKDIFTFSDRLSDGRYISLPLVMDSIYLHTGDKLKVDMYCVDKNVHDYFFQLAQSSTTGAFSTTASPANPSTNLTNGAFGYWSAHTVSSRTVMVY